MGLFPLTLMMQVALMPLSLLSTQVPLIFHSICSVRFFQKAVVVIMIVEPAHTCNIVRRGTCTRLIDYSCKRPRPTIASQESIYLGAYGNAIAMTSLIKLERAQNENDALRTVTQILTRVGWKQLLRY